MNRADFRDLRKRLRLEKQEGVPFMGFNGRVPNNGFTESQVKELFKLGYTKVVQHPLKGYYLLKGDK